VCETSGHDAGWCALPSLSLPPGQEGRMKGTLKRQQKTKTVPDVKQAALTQGNCAGQILLGIQEGERVYAQCPALLNVSGLLYSGSSLCHLSGSSLLFGPPSISFLQTTHQLPGPLVHRHIYLALSLSTP
jgi:hypothetical protein